MSSATLRRRTAIAERDVARRAARWLREHAWPLWLDHGVDWRAGAFHEHLDPATLECAADFRRLRVAARQVYCFARAAEAGVARAGDAVALGLDFLARARRPDGGYAGRFDLAGRTIDDTRDLYDHAFVLLAYAQADARADALALAEHLEARFRHPGGGYRETLPPAPERRQDPHMHLLEAGLAAFERFGDAIFLDMAERVIALFLGRFLPRGVLAEAFDARWRPLGEGGRHVVCPGHLCEWAWLIERHRAAASRRVPETLVEAGAALMAFVDRHGAHPSLGTLMDGVWSDGAVHAETARLWPQTERLKAEATRPDATPARVAAAFAALDRHIDGAVPGLWHERLATDGTPVPGPAPASSLYHLSCGILESGAALRARGW